VDCVRGLRGLVWDEEEEARAEENMRLVTT